MALILLATTWPFSDFQDHAHWARVEWVPFMTYRRWFDVLANTLLFVPFGVAGAWGRHGRRAIVAVAATGLACSLAVEFLQVYTHNRSATTTDVVTNTLGAWLGAAWAVRRARPKAADRSLK